jgi:hypothetical protein
MNEKFIIFGNPGQRLVTDRHGAFMGDEKHGAFMGDEKHGAFTFMWELLEGAREVVPAEFAP